MKRKQNFNTPSSSLELSKKQKVIKETPRSITDPIIQVSRPPTASIPTPSQMTPKNAFPKFDIGRVHIQLVSGEPACYQLHKPVLERHSPWFKQEFEKSAKEDQDYTFFLDQDLHINVPLLHQKRISIATATSSQSLPSLTTPTGGLAVIDLTTPAKKLPKTETPTGDDLKYPGLRADVKPEGVPQSATTTAILAQQKQANESNAIAKKRYKGFVEAHHHLFRIYYHYLPQLHSTDAGQALLQCEKIVTLASIYRCLNIVRPYLGSILLQFHRDLYIAIARDPPRWLNLSVALESGPLFTEALIHCAGCWPLCEWPTSSSSLSPPTIKVVESKAKWLADLRSKINLELLVDSHKIPLEGEQHVREKLLSIYHTLLSEQIYKDRTTGKQHLKTIYKAIFEGGEAFLPEEQVAAISGYDEDEIRDDLNTLKSFAKRPVAPLLEDNLMAKPQTLGIKYFTCIEVTAQDYPWSTSHS